MVHKIDTHIKVLILVIFLQIQAGNDSHLILMACVLQIVIVVKVVIE